MPKNGELLTTILPKKACVAFSPSIRQKAAPKMDPLVSRQRGEICLLSIACNWSHPRLRILRILNLKSSGRIRAYNPSVNRSLVGGGEALRHATFSATL
jgi:hypothetical protein